MIKRNFSKSFNIHCDGECDGMEVDYNYELILNAYVRDTNVLNEFREFAYRVLNIIFPFKFIIR